MSLILASLPRARQEGARERFVRPLMKPTHCHWITWSDLKSTQP